MVQSGKILRQRYKIIDSLGSGGFGDTYLAEDLDIPVKPKPKCVVKHLSPKSSDPVVLTIAQKLFEREAETLYKLGKDSDQIPKLFAHFQEGTEFCLVQEYIEGHDISKELTPGKKLSECYTIALLKGILSALAVAHQNNIIHRDIKPQNLMRRKSDNKIVLIDFGAVKEISVLTTANQPGTTTLTVAVGTPGYMPSEQSNGKPKLSNDIYAVGIVGIKALTGKDPQNLPTDPKTGNIIWQNQAQVSNRLANILDRMVHEYFPLCRHLQPQLGFSDCLVCLSFLGFFPFVLCSFPLFPFPLFFFFLSLPRSRKIFFSEWEKSGQDKDFATDAPMDVGMII